MGEPLHVLMVDADPAQLMRWSAAAAVRPDVDLYATATIGAARRWSSERSVHMALFALPHPDMVGALALLDELYESGVPIFVLTDDVTRSRSRLASWANVVLLERPFQLADLLG